MSDNVRKAILIGIVVVLAIVLAGVLFWKNSQAPSEPTDSENMSSNQEQSGENKPSENAQSSDDESTSSSNDISSQNWETYTAPSLGFSLKHPKDVDISTPNRTTRRFRFLGPNNTENSEITDGFTMTVSVDQGVGSQYSSLEAYAQAKFKQQTQRTNQGRAPQPIALANKPAYVYSAPSELGNEITYYVFLNTKTSRGYQVSISTSTTPSQSEYKYNEIIDKMLDSFSFNVSAQSN